VVDGAAVRVSLVGFSLKDAGHTSIHLDGVTVDRINSDLSGSTTDVTRAKTLLENIGVAFIGNQKGGIFDVPGSTARSFLKSPVNPNGRLNSDVVFPWINGLDIVRRHRDFWIVDFTGKDEAASALYEKPFLHVVQNVRAYRVSSAHPSSRDTWWLHQRPRHAFRGASKHLQRYIATARLAKHRVFVWCVPATVPDSQVVAITRDDDTTFGILHSRFHELWALRMGTSLEDRPRYTPTTTFETYPFPEGLTPDVPASAYADDPRALTIAIAAARLNELRENWLNPADLVRREPEVVPGYPDRIMPVSSEAAKLLQKRTLTNLYNERPAWLDHAHKALDAAVAAAYGWPADLSDEEVLARLFALNQERAVGKPHGGPSAALVELEEVD
jgi:type II restriction/modification system DNA methylase subunit YeeA